MRNVTISVTTLVSDFGGQISEDSGARCRISHHPPPTP
jgi:hypothetical protein